MNNTRLLVLASFAVCVITLIPNRREKFTEWFDHGKPSREVVLAADEINLNNYDEFEPKMTHDVMDRIVRDELAGSSACACRRTSSRRPP